MKPLLLDDSFSFFLITIFSRFLKKFYCSIVDFNVMLVSGIQQSESVVYTHVSTPFYIPFPYRSFQIIGQSSLWYTVGPKYMECFTNLHVILGQSFSVSFQF